MRCILVSHAHWDREWYRPFQAFRARLVDLVDRVLDLCAADPGFHFLLDGQTIVLEDYLEIRPGRRAELAAACAAGRIAIGPWWVQPDSFLPSGEAHVRNLLEGRRVGATLGPVSRVAYCPDSFGHPAQFPQLFAGFALGPFVYWRGNGDELDALGNDWVWEAPDGTRVPAHHLADGYFAAAGLPTDPPAAARWLADVARGLAARSRTGVVVLMNGFDHALPDAHAGTVAEALAATTGWTVVRGLLDDLPAAAPDTPSFAGELRGARVANLLPGVWSSRMPLKLRNRRAEALLEGWAEPWAALGAMLGAPDERPALRAAWRALLQNQAHDSIGGCALDRVHEQMQARYDVAEELAEETTARALERVAGLDVERRSPWDDTFDVAVFNPSPHPRTDLVRFPLVPRAWIEFRGHDARALALHPWLFGREGVTVDGRPARLVLNHATDQIRLAPDVPPTTVEFLAADVPAFGWRRFRLAPSGAHASDEDDGREIACDGIVVGADGDGTLAVQIGGQRYERLAALEDVGDRGDTYDHDPVPGGALVLEAVHVHRAADPTGVRRLTVRRTFAVPTALTVDRRKRSAARVPLVLELEVRLVPGTGRVDLAVVLTNEACDHRVRLLFPTGSPVAELVAATTFDVARRPTALPDAARWVHPAPRTFPHQGFVHANGLTVVAPGLPEVEVTPEGIIGLTLVRAVGWLARMDLATRPEPAGPLVPTPGAQCLGTITARCALLASVDPRAARDAELGLRAVVAGEAPLAPAGRPLLELAPREAVLSALKPAEDGRGTIVRLLNPTGSPLVAELRPGIEVTEAVPVRLDETPAGPPLDLARGRLAVGLPAHALRSVRLV